MTWAWTLLYFVNCFISSGRRQGEGNGNGAEVRSINTFHWTYHLIGWGLPLLVGFLNIFVLLHIYEPSSPTSSSSSSSALPSSLFSSSSSPSSFDSFSLYFSLVSSSDSSSSSASSSFSSSGSSLPLICVSMDSDPSVINLIFTPFLLLVFVLMPLFIFFIRKRLRTKMISKGIWTSEEREEQRLVLLRLSRCTSLLPFLTLFRAYSYSTSSLLLLCKLFFSLSSFLSFPFLSFLILMMLLPHLSRSPLDFRFRLVTLSTKLVPFNSWNLSWSFNLKNHLMVDISNSGTLKCNLLSLHQRRKKNQIEEGFLPIFQEMVLF
jgi:hypothetical protein